MKDLQEVNMLDEFLFTLLGIVIGVTLTSFREIATYLGKRLTKKAKQEIKKMTD
jgi:spore maturation protein SpmB